MGLEAGWDEWENKTLILDERISGFTRWVKNFIMGGYGLAPGAGLQAIIGQVGLNVAYINGYEVKQLGAVPVVLAPNAINHIFLRFLKTPDPISGTKAITIGYVINLSGVAPLDSIKLGTVITNAGSVVTVTPINNKYRLHDVQLETDIDGNHFQIKELVIHKGTAFPLSPQAGQHFFRTDLGIEFLFNGVIWVPISAGSLGAQFAQDVFFPSFNGQTAFVLSAAFVGAGGLSVVSANGQTVAEGVDYTIVGTAFTWLNAIFVLQTIDRLIIRYQTA